MIKKVHYLQKKIKMPHLYIDDLISIEKIIKEDLNPQSYNVELADDIWESINDIPKSIKKTNDFSINTKSPEIRIKFQKSYSEVCYFDDDVKTIGVVSKIINILRKRERIGFYYTLKVIPWFLMFSVSSISFNANNIPKKYQSNVIILLIFFVLLFFLSYRMDVKKHSIIEFISSY
ncbi:MAG: hypothetical protein Q7K21_03245, partial [Elusimicrobiota bacterium]|nr:hypothetical protein [Elusimicrobiota bacterium]